MASAAKVGEVVAAVVVVILAVIGMSMFL
jgi:hypothetical protein